MADAAQQPADPRALVAIDLGAESCRVSLLRWLEGKPVIQLVHRFANAPCEADGELRWNLGLMESGLEEGLRRCAEMAPEGIRSLAVDGWAVDYVRLDNEARAVADPYCYRDERTVEAEASFYGRISRQRVRELTGVQSLRINTAIQLHADTLAGTPSRPWLNLPEYILFRLGGARVAELTNATHTQLVGLQSASWCAELFDAAGADVACAAPLAAPGTIVGKLQGSLTELAAFADTTLIAPACHDTASAIAGIPAEGDDWAYISSGTWSLVGTLLREPGNHAAACADDFTHLAGVGGTLLCHRSVNGMWLLKQCMEAWKQQGREWAVADLILASEQVPQPAGLLDVDAPEFLLPGGMLAKINRQLRERGLQPLDEAAHNAPRYASLILHSLAARYATVVKSLAVHTGKKLECIYVVGGGSRNEFLNRLTERATGLRVIRASAESSTIGNFAVQLARLEDAVCAEEAVSAHQVARWSAYLPQEIATI